MRTLIILAFALTTLPALAAPPKACDFITLQQASAVFGRPLHAGKEDTISIIFSQCVFSDDFNGDVQFDIGTVADLATSMGAGPAQILPIVKATSGSEIPNAFPGLGEWNCYDPSNFTAKVLYHGKLVTLQANNSKNPGLKAALADALRQILPKL